MDFNLIVTDGGAGDLICELVAVDYNIKHNPHMNFAVWLPDYLEEFARHVLPAMTRIKPFSGIKFGESVHAMSTRWKSGHTPMRTHPVDYGFHMLADRHEYILDNKNYLQIRPKEIDVSEFGLPDKYVCMASASAEPVKAMPVQTANTLIDYVIEKGYTPVFLGREHSPCGFKDFSVKAVKIPMNLKKGIDLTNQTSLLQSAKILSGGVAYIGMDGGLTHLAGCTDTFIVAGYTLVDPIHIAPIRRGSQTYKFGAVEPDTDIPNRYYQTYACTFRKGDLRRFPGWSKVVASMTADKFIKSLDGVL